MRIASRKIARVKHVHSKRKLRGKRVRTLALAEAVDVPLSTQVRTAATGEVSVYSGRDRSSNMLLLSPMKGAEVLQLETVDAGGTALVTMNVDTIGLHDRVLGCSDNLLLL